VTDATIKELKKLPKLSSLTLQRTGVSNAGAKVLAEMEQLTFLNVYQTKITQDIVRDLHTALPKCHVFPPR
jgi:hypothetical protein